MSKAVYLGVGCFLGTVFGQAPMAQKDIDRAIEKLQTSYDKMESMKAHFNQVYSGKLGNAEKNSGELTLKKPGKMKWTYDSPKGKYITSDGALLVLYDPKTNQAIVQPQNQNTKLPAVVSLLMGGVKIKSTFDITEGSTQEKALTLHLKPKEKIPNVQTIEIDIDKSDLAKISTVRILDDLSGTNEIHFSKIKFNVKIPSTVFDTKTPKGATVVTGDPMPM